VAQAAINHASNNHTTVLITAADQQAGSGWVLAQIPRTFVFVEQ